MRAFARYCEGEVHLDRQPDAAAAALEEAVQLARSVDNQLVYGVSLVCLASLQGRRGRSDRALPLFREAVAHWCRLGNHTHQLTTLRNLVELLAQLGEHRSAAIIYGAVTGGGAPSFGAEAQRLAAAWQQVQHHLGVEQAEQLVAKGRRLDPTRRGDEALTQLDLLLRQ